MMDLREVFPDAEYIDLSDMGEEEGSEVKTDESRAQPKADIEINLADEGEDEDEYEEIEGAAAGGESLPVPTSASKKSEIQHYLTYEHGVDPDDLDMTKTDLLGLVEGLNKSEEQA